MFDYVKMKATSNQRIRVGSEKKEVKKNEIVEVRKSEVTFFVWYGFIEGKREYKEPVLKTIKEKLTPKKKISAKKK